MKQLLILPIGLVLLLQAVVLARQPNVGFSTANWVQDNLSPRIWKLGVRVSWR